jgi:hypothetical protein
MQNSKLTPANLTILIAGVVILLASFLPFYKLSVAGFHHNYNAWDSDIGLFGIGTLPAILGAIMALHVALTSFANVSLQRRVAGFTWNQVHLLLAFQALVMMLAFLIRDKSVYAFGIGFVLMLLASVGLMVGAIMRDREPASTL